jgi:hypothetical protein
MASLTRLMLMTKSPSHYSPPTKLLRHEPEEQAWGCIVSPGPGWWQNAADDTKHLYYRLDCPILPVKPMPSNSVSFPYTQVGSDLCYSDPLACIKGERELHNQTRVTRRSLPTSPNSSLIASHCTIPNQHTPMDLFEFTVPSSIVFDTPTPTISNAAEQTSPRCIVA